MSLTRLIGNDTVFATMGSAAFVVLHITAVHTSQQRLYTPVGPEVVAVFPAALEVFIIVGLCWRLGSLAGVAVIFTSYSLGLALASHAAVIPTTAGKLAVVAVVAPLMPTWRNWHPLSLLLGMVSLAMVVDTVVFAMTYGNLAVIPASLFIKSLFMVSAVTIFGARKPGGRRAGDPQPAADAAGR